MLELWSGVRFVFTPHQVFNATGADLYSFLFFMLQCNDVTVAPLLGPFAGFFGPAVECGHWSAGICRTNWPDERAPRYACAEDPGKPLERILPDAQQQL